MSTREPGYVWLMDRNKRTEGVAVPVEDAAAICRCAPDEIRRWRKQVLPRSRGSVGDLELFSVSEVVAMAAGTVARTWHIKASFDQLVARLALIDGAERDWVAVYESRKGVRIDRTPFTLPLSGRKRGAFFDPWPYYEAFDAAITARSPDKTEVLSDRMSYDSSSRASTPPSASGSTHFTDEV